MIKLSTMRKESTRKRIESTRKRKESTRKRKAYSKSIDDVVNVVLRGSFKTVDSKLYEVISDYLYGEVSGYSDTFNIDIESTYEGRISVDITNLTENEADEVSHLFKRSMVYKSLVVDHDEEESIVSFEVNWETKQTAV